MKELLWVCSGSFLGGGARYLVGRLLQASVSASFPWATLVVNVVGCFLIGLLSGSSMASHLPTHAKMFLVMGFCGGFTTFSTFMNENLLMARSGSLLSALIYTAVSLLLGLAAVVAGYEIMK